MRKINKDYLSPPSPLTGAGANTKLLAITVAGSYSETTYKRTTVITALNALYHNKCGYCEALITTVSYPHVEHYRPKGGVNTVDLSGPAHPGYYWLGNEWSNLLIACIWCNGNGRKGIRFPLAVPASRVLTHPTLVSSGVYNIAANHINHVYLGPEDPLILNPEVSDPLKHLTVKQTGELKEKNNSRKGRTTISICDLNRGGLILSRKGIIDGIVDEINEMLEEHFAIDEPITENQFRRRLYNLLDKITYNTLEKAQYTLVFYEIINKFNALIIAHKNIERVFRPLIKKHFDSY